MVLKQRKVTVLVAGSWGTALASVLAEKHEKVVVWSKNVDQIKEINEEHRNQRFLPGIALPSNIYATQSIRDAVEGADAVILAAPTSAMREVATLMAPHVNKNALLVHAAKGFEAGSLKRMSTVIAESVPAYDKKRVAVISGPSHAEEVIRKNPTTVVVAAESMDAAEAVQDLLINSYFRVYTNTDVIGVEVGGALKNIIAIGGGLSDGLGYGDNAKAALLTRGLAEITRLGTSMGASPMTFSGLAGIGDLVVTCTSRHSRNWRAGYMLGQGETLDRVLQKMGMVVEGVRTTESAMALSGQYHVEMPITSELYHVLFSDKSPQAAVEDLMGRGRTHEIFDR